MGFRVWGLGRRVSGHAEALQERQQAEGPEKHVDARLGGFRGLGFRV